MFHAILLLKYRSKNPSRYLRDFASGRGLVIADVKRYPSKRSLTRRTLDVHKHFFFLNNNRIIEVTMSLGSPFSILSLSLLDIRA